MGQNHSHSHSHAASSSIERCDETTAHLPGDRAVYELIHNTSFTVDSTTVREGCESLKSFLLAQGRTIDTICMGEHIFMLILMEFLNQSIMLGRIQPGQLKIVVDTFDMHHMLLTVCAEAQSIMTHYDTDVYNNIIPQYTFSREDGSLRCKGKLFIDVLHELPPARGNHILELVHDTFASELIKCIQCQPFPVPSAPLKCEDPT